MAVDSLWAISALPLLFASRQSARARIAADQTDHFSMIQKAEASSGSLLTLRYT
jgi:hypothetical protein